MCIYRICRSIGRSSSVSTQRARGVRLIIIANAGIYAYAVQSTPRWLAQWQVYTACYTAGFKLKVVETAEKCGNRAAGREHSVNEKLSSN